MSDDPTKLQEPDLSGSYTARDYLSWQLDELVELIRGKVFRMSPSPTSNHQRIVWNLTRNFDDFFENKKCEAFGAPLDVYLVKPGQDYKDTENIVEPDIFVVCDPEKIKTFGCVGAPDLVVEILSPSTSRKDLKLKFDLYEEYGVREYWIISPEKRDITISVLERGKYNTLASVSDDGMVTSVIFPELSVDLKDVFKRVKD